MKTVPLVGKRAAGRVALVSDEDYDLVMGYRWYAHIVVKDGHRPVGPYAVTRVKRGGRWTTIQMHMMITGWAMTDHIDHDGLNNQRFNLRPATKAQNSQNSRRWVNSSSQFKGVSRHADKWRARLRVEGETRFLGSFTSDVEAARAYDFAAVEAYGEYACINFPGEPLQAPTKNRTLCRECQAPIPPNRKLYCSRRCGRAVWRRTEASKKRDLAD